MHLTLRSRARNVFGVQLYKNNARALLSRILSNVNSDWLQHAHSLLRGVYEYFITLENMSVEEADFMFLSKFWKKKGKKKKKKKKTLLIFHVGMFDPDF